MKFCNVECSVSRRALPSEVRTGQSADAAYATNVAGECGGGEKKGEKEREEEEEKEERKERGAGAEKSDAAAACGGRRMR